MRLRATAAAAAAAALALLAPVALAAALDTTAAGAGSSAPEGSHAGSRLGLSMHAGAAVQPHAQEASPADREHHADVADTHKVPSAGAAAAATAGGASSQQTEAVKKLDAKVVHAQIGAHGSVMQDAAAAAQAQQGQRQRGQQAVQLQQQALGLIRREKAATAASTADRLGGAVTRGNASDDDQENDYDEERAVAVTAHTATLRRQDPDQGLVRLVNGWSPYGGVWSPVTYALRAHLCFITGLAKAGEWGGIGELPPPCRPKQRDVFNVGNHQFSSRVDVEGDGKISWVAGGRSHGYLSLSGIVFATSGLLSVDLPLNNGWVAYGEAYGTPSFTVSQGFCVIEGLIKGGGWGHLASLPEDCRPRKRLIFNLNNNEAAARVDVLTNGQIHWIAGGNKNGWMSLSGIMFSVTAGNQNGVDLLFGWKSYLNGWGTPTFTVEDGICVVEGLVAGTNWGTIGMLPSECRPDKRLVFQMNNNELDSRVDILQDGTISWQAGGKSHGWLSLSGIVFDIQKKSQQGSKGVNGAPGLNGQNGQSGQKGDPGPMGERGQPGPPGAMGIMGDMGPAGRPGAKGDKGDKGDVGATGMTGEKGDAGPPGRNGVPGPIGPPGLNGLQGPPGKDAAGVNKVDCVWMSWMDWFPCSATCGGGLTWRQRSVQTYPQDGGANCDGGSFQEDKCNVVVCPGSGGTAVSSSAGSSSSADGVAVKSTAPMSDKGNVTTNGTNASKRSAAAPRFGGSTVLSLLLASGLSAASWALAW